VLASRENGGIRVTLLWARDTDGVAVRVLDDSSDEQFELSVRPALNPLDAYKHPYAYAVWRGVDYQNTQLQHAN
jgi:hypothetical protein